MQIEKPSTRPEDARYVRVDRTQAYARYACFFVLPVLLIGIGAFLRDMDEYSRTVLIWIGLGILILECTCATCLCCVTWADEMLDNEGFTISDD